MPNIIGVRFKPVTKIYYFLPLADTPLKVSDPVIVKTSRGQELGWVAIEPKQVPRKEVKGTLKPVLRKATPLDLIKMEEYKALEAEALEKCKQQVAKTGLPMKAIQAEYSYDGSKLLFLFTAEQRVDFRDLVRNMVRAFRTRVEMRQIGARDEAKIIDGYGRCGRRICCSSWLTDFHPVSIRMAKNQNLPLAPTEISGLCGRLLCCLSYEDEMYKAVRKTLPRTGSIVETPEGKGRIRGLNILKETAIVALDNDTRIEIPVSEIEVIKSPSSRPQKRSRKSTKRKGQTRQ
ncbi:MAG TPA: stage 0 sporulation family protein [Chloroflexi bacterium]|nr:stage 0 sporulation family protein [Chloroflexota bacterium]